MKDVNTQTLEAESLYPIRTVSNLTGVNSITLRAWERRYGLIEPKRTEKGHRLYTKQDITLINRVVALLESGVAISQAQEHLERADKTHVKSGVRQDQWTIYRKELLAAIARFDIIVLDGCYTEALSIYPPEQVTERLVRPVLRTLGANWQETGTGISQEHFFTTYLRSKIGARINHLIGRQCHTRILASCLPGEQHEVGLLLFCLAASSHGYGFLILGANTPLGELAETSRSAACQAILLSGSISANSDTFEEDLSKLTEESEHLVYVGGQIAVDLNKEIKRSGAHALGTDFNTALRKLNSALRNERAAH